MDIENLTPSDSLRCIFNISGASSAFEVFTLVPQMHRFFFQLAKSMPFYLRHFTYVIQISNIDLLPVT